MHPANELGALETKRLELAAEIILESDAVKAHLLQDELLKTDLQIAAFEGGASCPSSIAAGVEFIAENGGGRG
jgi:hypothetical protein